MTCTSASTAAAGRRRAAPSTASFEEFLDFLGGHLRWELVLGHDEACPTLRPLWPGGVARAGGLQLPNPTSGHPKKYVGRHQKSQQERDEQNRPCGETYRDERSLQRSTPGRGDFGEGEGSQHGKHHTTTPPTGLMVARLQPRPAEDPVPRRARRHVSEPTNHPFLVQETRLHHKSTITVGFGAKPRLFGVIVTTRRKSESL